MKTGLTALIHPHTLEDFFTSYNLHKPFFVGEMGEDAKALFDLPFLSSLNALLNSWPAPIQVHLPDLRDEASSLDTTAKDAQDYFDQGMGLLFNEAHHLSPLLSQWVQEIRSDLGLSALTLGRCLIYATPDGQGTAAHFDQNINFVLQIHGTKRWTMAPNQHVTNPLTRHTMGQEPDPELMTYLDAPMPTQMPEDALSFELKPGSLLFVPRGWWHATEAEGDALALNFTFSAPSWIDLFTAALRGRLVQSPAWRETARLKTAEQKFDSLLAALVEDLSLWKASNILTITETDKDNSSK